MSAIAGSVAVGLIRPHLQQTKSPVAIINATDMPALRKPASRAIGPLAVGLLLKYFHQLTRHRRSWS
jgi:hypothetical protein